MLCLLQPAALLGTPLCADSPSGAGLLSAHRSCSLSISTLPPPGLPPLLPPMCRRRGAPAELWNRNTNTRERCCGGTLHACLGCSQL